MSPNINLAQSTQIDEQSRIDILSCLDKNLFVIAGAGSGKTSMLVARMVAMVESGIDISKICAITFTKKAAAEFLERFQQKLKERTLLSYPNQQSPTPADLCKKALKDIDLCFTGTIDSFCNLVLSEYPNNAKIPSSSAVVMDDELVELCKLEYKKIANDPIHPLKDKFNVFNQLFRNGAEVFGKSIKTVMDYAHLHIIYNHPTKSAYDALDDLKARYRQNILNDFALLSTKKDNIAENQTYIDAFDSFMQRYKGLQKDWTLDTISSYRKSIKFVIANIRLDDLPPFTFFEFRETTLKGLAGTTYYRPVEEPTIYQTFSNEVDELIYTYAMDFLCAAADEIRKELKKQGKLSFTEYLVTFRDMVKDDMDKGMHLIKHIRSKHQHFLLDESQDTSPVQTELFLLLCSSVKAKRIEDAKPIPGSIFIVGDPKQSIYGFRGADVNAYLHTKSLFENVYDQNYNKVVYLTKNFRSSLELCKYFNSQFVNLPNYDPIPTSAIKTPDKSIEHEILSGPYLSANYISAIQSLVNKHYIFDKKLCEDEEKELNNNPNAFNNKPRTFGKRLIQYSDVMLLTWSKTKHNAIIKELVENKIPVFCEGQFTVSGCDALQTIYALFSYVAGEPGQFENILSSPLFEISPNAIAGVSQTADLPDCPQKDLLIAVEQLKDIDNPIILFNKISERMSLYLYIDFMNVEYVVFAFEKLKEAYNSGLVSDVKSAALFLKEYVSTPLERGANLEYKPNAVFLANVHKVKGLERPVVILYEGIFGSKDPENDSDYQSGEAYIFKTSKVDYNGVQFYDISSGSLYESQEAVASNKKEEENGRLGYVAVTRARNVLIIPPQSKKNSVWNSIRPERTLNPIPGSELPDISVETVKQLSFEEPAEFNKAATYEEMSPSKQAHAQSKISFETIEDNNVSSDDSTIKGTIVHRLMEILVNSKGQMPKDLLVNQVLNEYGLDQASIYHDILEKVYETMTRGGYSQKSKNVPQDLLNEIKGCETHCEVPFSFKKNSEIWQGTIDLLYIKNGKHYIIDYKTNADDSNLEQFYENQLNAYKEALKELLGVEAEANIYHIAI